MAVREILKYPGVQRITLAELDPNMTQLYTTSFYALLDQHLSASGYAVIQTTSPLVASRTPFHLPTQLPPGLRYLD